MVRNVNIQHVRLILINYWMCIIISSYIYTVCIIDNLFTYNSVLYLQAATHLIVTKSFVQAGGRYYSH